MCHQMIMGAGKTTVVAPTLGLLLADGRRLVMEVPCPVPPHYLRSVTNYRLVFIISI